MKKRYVSGLAALLFLTMVPFACRKSISETVTNPPPPPPSGTDTTHTSQQPPVTQPAQTVPYPETPVSGCAYAPDYGDTLIYPQPTGSDYIVSPTNNPGPGKYYSWPEGLVIDSLSGAINVTKSETGERYAIGFVKNGTTDTCMQTLIIGGAAYMDSIYVLANGQTKAKPYYDANPFQTPPCNGSGVSGPGCQYDVTGDAASKKIIIDNNTGEIDLQKTLNGGLLGGAFGLLPVNGQTVETTIYYRLNDGSNNALQKITVQLVYYTYKSQISTGLLDNVVLKLDNVLTGNIISKSGNPRPPLIIITRYN